MVAVQGEMLVSDFLEIAKAFGPGLVLGGVGGFIVVLLEALATMGYLHK